MHEPDVRDRQPDARDCQLRERLAKAVDSQNPKRVTFNDVENWVRFGGRPYRELENLHFSERELTAIKAIGHFVDARNGDCAKDPFTLADGYLLAAIQLLPVDCRSVPETLRAYYLTSKKMLGARHSKTVHLLSMVRDADRRFVEGSTYTDDEQDALVLDLEPYCRAPMVVFPGGVALSCWDGRISRTQINLSPNRLLLHLERQIACTALQRSHRLENLH